MTLRRASALLAILGAVLLPGGLVWDVIFAGIPYQDPPPELLARWTFHKAVAGWLMTAGAAALAAAALVGLLGRRR